MNVLLLIVSIVANLFCFGILRNDFCKKDCANDADLQLFNGISSIFSALTLVVIALISGSLCMPSMYTVLLGVVFGMATALCAVFNMKALECGPLSYTSVIGSFAMVIPALSGLVLFGEAVSASQWIGIVVMLFSFVCAVDMKNDTAGTSLKWMLFCLSAFVFSGSVGVMQKIHQNSPHKDELAVFLVIAFITSIVFSLIMTAFYCKKGAKITVLKPEKIKKFAIINVVCGIGIALINQINMYLAGQIPAIIFYPIINGAPMILTSAAGLILWKEKLSKKQWVGMIAGAIAIFLLCNIF